MDAGTTYPAVPAMNPPTLTSQHSALAIIPEDFIKEEDDGTDDELKQVSTITPEATTSEQRILQLLRQSLLPFSDRLDPFAALPVSLGRFEEHLVTFYLLHYPKVTYGFSSSLQPHPVATNFSIALTTPACFQVILARAALYRLTLCKYADGAQKKDLEVSMMRHKGEALKEIRLLNAKPPSPTRKDDLLASIISIGTLDRRTGDSKTSGMHYMAVRRILRVTGGPLAVRSLLLSRVMVFFECIYGTSPESYIWDSSDLQGLVQQANRFLGKVWRMWQLLSSSPFLRPRNPKTTHTTETTADAQPKGQLFYLTSGTPLHTILTRSPIPPNSTTDDPNPLQRLELMTQLTCLITLTSLFLDHVKTKRYAALTMTMLDLNHAVTKLCPKVPPSTADTTHPPARPQGSIPSSTPSANTIKPATTPQKPPLRPAPPPASYSSNTSRSLAPKNKPSSTNPTNHRPLAPAPAPDSQSKPPLTTNQHSSTIPSSSIVTHPSLPEHSSSHTPKEDPTLINASNVMWLLHITDHSAAHTRRIWSCAAYAWVAKHLSYNTQKVWKEWLVRLLEGRGCFEADGEGDERHAIIDREESAKGKEKRPERESESSRVREEVRERWTTMAAALGQGTGKEEEQGRGQAGTNITLGDEGNKQVKGRKKQRKLKERPFTLDAWAFSYAN